MRTGIATVTALLCLVAANDPAPVHAQAPVSVSPQVALINQYCMGCHSDRVKSGGLALSALNLDTFGDNGPSSGSAEIAEKVIRKLRGGLMPPGGAPRPEAHATAEFVS